MLVALPSAIAYGIAALTPLGADQVAAGATAGVLGAIALGLVAPLLGGTPRLVSAPCAPAAAVMAGLTSKLADRGASAGPLLSLVGVLSGGLQLLYGAVRGGRLIKYIPYPVVSGYLSGVGVLIFLGQLPKLLGLEAGTPLGAGVLTPALWSLPSLGVGAATMAAMLVAPRLTRAIPAPVLGLLAGLLVYFGLALLVDRRLLVQGGNHLLIGPISAGPVELATGVARRWASFRELRLGDLASLLVPGLTLSVLLSIDTLKTCVVVDALTRSRHDSNRELLGQGFGNLCAALIGGMPGAGTMGPTLVNVSSGGRTRLSGVLAGAGALVAALLLGRLIAWVPLGALAGILTVVAGRMLDRHSLRLLRQRSTVLDFVVMLAVVVVAVRYSLIAAAGAGLGLAIFLFLRDQVHGTVIRRRARGSQLSSKQRRLPVEKELLQREGERTLVCELQGSLFFGTTDQLLSELEPELKTCRFIILDLRRVQSVDFTAAHMLEQIEATLEERGARLLFSSLPASLPTGQDLQRYFAHLGLVKPSHTASVFETLDEALEWTEDRLLEEHQLLRSREEQPLELAGVELLRELGGDELAALGACVEERSFEAGGTIFRRGDEGDELLLIRRGLVRVVLPLDGGKHHNLATFARGDFFGDMAFLDHGTRSADALATTRTDLYAISRRRFDELSRAHPELGVRIFARLARALALRLRYTDGELRSLQES